MESVWQRHAAARQFALGFALIGLMLTLIGAVLLAFPLKVTASQTVQGKLLYDLLGHLDYQRNGQFSAVNDERMQRRLKRLLVENHLDGINGFAYIRHLNSRTIVWGAKAPALDDRAPFSANGYELQFVHAARYQLAVQNFWVRHNQQREEYQMVVALPTN